jgi:hypothetical protein
LLTFIILIFLFSDVEWVFDSTQVNGTTLCISSKDTNQRSHHGPPRSPWMSFSELFMRMKLKLPRSNMDILERHYAKFKVRLVQFIVLSAVPSINAMLTHDCFIPFSAGWENVTMCSYKAC